MIGADSLATLHFPPTRQLRNLSSKSFAPVPLIIMQHIQTPNNLDLTTMHFDGFRNAHLEKVAAELYSDQMPYHNFNHVLVRW